jgi:hypothetical protein
MSVGCHELLREHPDATLVTGVPHVLEAVGRIGEYLAPPARGPEHRRDSLDEESVLVLEAVPARGTITTEELASRAGLTVRTVLRRLSLLELPGRVGRRAGDTALPRGSGAAPCAPTTPGRRRRSVLGVVEVVPVDLHPRLDVVGEPHLALRQIGDRLGEVGPTGDLVRTLPTDPTQSDSDLVRAHEPDRFHCHEIDRRRETISR